MSETIFVTGGTGFLGSYVVDVLMQDTDVRLAILTRARDRREGIEKLWRGLQMHMSAERFYSILPRIELVPGDLTAPGLGMERRSRAALVETADSVLHIAASLNRKSAKSCLNHNLRGTLSVLGLAREIADDHELRRFSHVSTVAVAGQRQSETVLEDEAIDWDRSDYDPYARTKKFCEHMVRELLPDVPKTFFRPSIVMGDSRFPETTQFDMVRAFCFLADLPAIPVPDDVRLDIVNADFVGRAVAELHVAAHPAHEIYHLSSGTSAPTTGEVARALVSKVGRRPARFVPSMTGAFSATVNALTVLPMRNQVSQVAALMKVFLPYITFDTVFDNTRVTMELGRDPVPFVDYCADLYRFAKGCDFRYPYQPLPKRAGKEAA